MSGPTFEEACDWLDEFVHSSCFDSSPDLDLMESDRTEIRTLANETENQIHASPSEMCHASETSHRPYKCSLDNCNETFVSHWERRSHDTIVFSISILIIASNAKRTFVPRPTYFDMPKSANTGHIPAVAGPYSRDLTSLIDISSLLGPIFHSIHVLSVNAIVVAKAFVAKIICCNT
ncbi:hypothetical protein EAF04_005759 [Stromatinia cepivora]|nr:hypothetical protein EAF04_005759 [Stromatinia cepivora]